MPSFEGEIRLGAYRMLIDGRALDGDDSAGVINPATAEVFERAPLCSTEQLERAVGLQCGTVWVNQHAAVVPDLPFGGWKHSSIGVENGPWGLLGYTQLQTVNVAKGKGHA